MGTGTDSSSDEELARRLFAGDEHGARILIDRYRRPLFGLLYRLTGNAADAEELFQDTFVRALRASSTFDPSRRFKPWIHAIAVNLARDLLGRRAHAATPELRAPEDLPQSEGVDREAEWVLRRDLSRALSTLPEGQREVVLLRYFEGREEAEIATIVGIPRGTVKSRLHHALRKMREALTE